MMPTRTTVRTTALMKIRTRCAKREFLTTPGDAPGAARAPFEYDHDMLNEIGRERSDGGQQNQLHSYF